MTGVLQVVITLALIAAAVGCGAFAALWLRDRLGSGPLPPEPDPYREGLDTVARISAMAWEATQAMHHLREEPRE